LETAPIENDRKIKLQLAPFLSRGGIVGPASDFISEGDDDGGDAGLWIMGTCDPDTSFTVDLDIDEEVPESCEMDEIGEVALKPAMQTCTLFTCVETDGSEPTPNYYTVCKMRVTSVSLPVVEDAEPIFDALDPEALSVILYHKSALDAYMTGFIEAQKTAEMWLQSFLVCVYQSALEEQAKLEEEMEREHRRHVWSSNDDATNFVASERLLDEEGGDLDEEDVLMGQGHYKVNVVPLIVYAIMQSDALRPCIGKFQPSMDARLCALTQMASMTPKALAKCFAPSLSLWSLKDDEPVVESLPLSGDGILSTLEDLGGDGESSSEDGIVFLESPQHVILYRSLDLQNILLGIGENGDKNKKRRSIKIGSKLESAILAGLNGYRTPPPQWSELEKFLDNHGGDLEEVKVSPSIFLSMLLEDKPTVGGERNFAEWSSKIAESVLEELKDNGDLE